MSGLIQNKGKVQATPCAPDAVPLRALRAPDAALPVQLSRKVAFIAPPRERFAQPDFRIAIDYGTTCTTVAYRKPQDHRGDAEIVENFPGDPRPGWSVEVPSDSCYLAPKQNDSLDPAAASFELRSGRRPKKAQGSETEYSFGHAVVKIDRQSEDSRREDFEYCVFARHTKLMFGHPAHQGATQGEVLKTLRMLKSLKAINRDEDAVVDALTYILKYCKSFFTGQHGMTEHSSVELVLCVPVCWDTKANAIMIGCLEIAMSRANFGLADGSSTFLVNEVEAAALSLLMDSWHPVSSTSSIVVADCGGGTTDIGMYRVNSVNPTRLSHELTPPTGAPIGATDLNSRLRAFAIEQLKDEHYLCNAEQGETIANMVDHEIMPVWEYDYKRTFSFQPEHSERMWRWTIRGLKASSTNTRLRGGTFQITHDDMVKIFMPSVLEIWKLVEDQLRKAHDIDRDIRHLYSMGEITEEEAEERLIDLSAVILVGGYADSVALQEKICELVANLNEELDTNIECVHPQKGRGAPGVAIGAVRRATNKHDGPARVPHTSYGVLRHLEYDSDITGDQRKQRREHSRFDGREEIRNTIKWVIKSGEGPLRRSHLVTFKSVHCFAQGADRWTAEEVLLSSDTCTEDGWKRSHEKNKGKWKEVGKITCDLTHLKPQIALTRPAGFAPYYTVECLVEMEVVDRNLTFHMRWPAIPLGTEVGKGVVRMTAAFVPGTL